MTKIREIWDKLKEDALDYSLNDQMLGRYIERDNKFFVLAFKTPEKVPILRIILNNQYYSVFQDIPELKHFEMKIEKLNIDNDDTYSFLLILRNQDYYDIFISLVEDLYNNIEIDVPENEYVCKIVSRIKKWHQFLEKTTLQGLSKTLQLGLFGELYFMRKFLLNIINPEVVLDMWSGPLRNSLDFQFNNLGFEIKSTIRKRNEIMINNKDQLDKSSFSNLFLVVLRVKELIRGSNTLNSIIEDIYQILSVSSPLGCKFTGLLIEYGYLKAHAKYYEEIYYDVKDIEIFKIDDKFPKLSEKNLPLGIIEVKYLVDLDSCLENLIKIDEFMEFINEINSIEKNGV